jgi:hypothetical protein
VIKKPFPQPLATAHEVFLATRPAADQFRAGGSSVRIRFYMEDGSAYSLHLTCLIRTITPLRPMPHE